LGLSKDANLLLSFASLQVGATGEDAKVVVQSGPGGGRSAKTG